MNTDCRCTPGQVSGQKNHLGHSVASDPLPAGSWSTVSMFSVFAILHKILKFKDWENLTYSVIAHSSIVRINSQFIYIILQGSVSALKHSLPFSKEEFIFFLGAEITCKMGISTEEKHQENKMAFFSFQTYALFKNRAGTHLNAGSQ